DLSIKRLQKAIDQARSYGFLGENILGSGFNFDIEIKKGAGAYICGEETALIESIEGKRGEPRKKPPYPPTYGLWGKPTVINNVETLANIPPIVVNGAEWFKKFGVPGSYGTKLFSLMGDINYKGVIEIPFGVKLSSIINDVGFGVKGGKSLKGVILGGVSGSLITPGELDTPVDFNSLAKIEAGPGSGSIVVLSEDRCIVDIAKNIAYFFRHESCGKCTPCRVGTEEMYKIIDYISRGLGEESDLTRLEKLSTTMKLTSFCGLGQTAPNIISQSLVKYRTEWLEHIKQRKCNANICEFEEITEEVSNE
ncbi:MAG: complex I 51 kDa subunit family protein, partial [Caldisericum exile]